MSRGPIRSALLSAALGTMLAMRGVAVAMPDLGQQRTLSSRPGSGLVRAAGRPKPRRDSERQAAAQAKRERKNAKRLRDWKRCHVGSWIKTSYPFAAGVNHGE